MDVQTYCRERVLVPGATITVFQHFLQRDYAARLIPLLALLDKITLVPDEVSETTVSQAKLGWWQEEIGRLQQGQARHPAAIAVQQSSVLQDTDLENLAGLVQLLALQPDPFESTDQLLAHSQRIGEAICGLEATLGGARLSRPGMLSSLGAGRYLVSRLRRIPLDRQQGLRWLPLDLQARFQISGSGQPAGYKSSNAWRELIGELSGMAQAEVQSGRAGLQTDLGGALPYLRIQSGLDERWLTKVKSRPERLLDKPVRIGSVNTVMIAWREARRARKELAGVAYAES